MTKVLIIGIDALDSQTISILGDLNNFSKIKNTWPQIQFDGVFPPDSPTSWASIYTGLSPTKHGILLFVDPLRRVGTMISEDVNDENIRGKTFWDIAGKHGKKVCILPHLLGYPPWAVNGIMVGRSSVKPDVQIFPQELSTQYEISNFKWDIPLIPGRNKSGFVKSAINQIERERKFGLQMLKQCDWDLFFISFGELDVIQYSYWNYFYEKDPGYPGLTSFKDVIPTFYKIYDSLVGEFIEAVDDSTIVFIVSDHGMGSRPVKLVNVNEILRQKNLIKLKNTENRSYSTERLFQIRKIVIKIVDKYNLGNVAATIMREIPTTKEWFLSSPIDWEKSSAYLTNQSGIKNYPYGGIMIKNQEMQEYEIIRNEIISTIQELRDPITGEKIVKWICKREILFNNDNGEYLKNYPDILFEFENNYGAGNLAPAPLFGISSSHNIAPGCHKQHNATLLIKGIPSFSKKYVTLMDVAPTILRILDIPIDEYRFDGSAIISPSI